MSDTVKAHTPGPWKFDVTNGTVIDTFSGFSVADIVGRPRKAGEFPNQSEPIANGYLIAAAPETLKTLEGARDHLIGMAAYLATCATSVILENLETTIAAIHKEEEKYEAVIRKARGEQ